MKKALPFLALCLCLPSFVPAQNPAFGLGSRLALLNLDYNAALLPQGNKWYFGLPGINSVYLGGNTSLTLRQMLSQGSDGRYYLDMDRLAANARAENELNLQPVIQLGSLGFRSGAGYWSAGLALRNQLQLVYSKDLLEFLANGNGAADAPVRLNQERLTARHYLDATIGYARNLGDGITVGGRLHFLRALGTLELDRWYVQLETSQQSFPAYALAAEADFALSATGAYALALDSSDTRTPSPAGYGAGLALDLGATYAINPTWTFMLSVHNLGNILLTPAADAKRIATSGTGTIYFDGFSYEPGNDNAPTFDEQANELEQQLQEAFPLSIQNEQVLTNLPGPSIVFATLADWNAYFRTAFTYQAFTDEFGLKSTLSATCFWHPNRWIELVGGLSWDNRSKLAIGAGMILDAGPLQLHLLTENLLFALNPVTARNGGIRLGATLTVDEKP